MDYQYLVNYVIILRFFLFAVKHNAIIPGYIIIDDIRLKLYTRTVNGTYYAVVICPVSLFDQLGDHLSHPLTIYSLIKFTNYTDSLVYGGIEYCPNRYLLLLGLDWTSHRILTPLAREVYSSLLLSVTRLNIYRKRLLPVADWFYYRPDLTSQPLQRYTLPLHDVVCVICLREGLQLSEPVNTPCNHVFCLQCIGRWWDNYHTRKCPMCVQPVD